jgi:hypothetical protein
MSWIFGIVGSGVNDDTRVRCGSIHPASLGTFEREGKYYIAAGGYPLTCRLSHSGSHRGLDCFAITLGCAFHDTGTEFKQLTQGDWNEIGDNEDLIDGLDGHFVRITLSQNKFVIRNDRLGLRSLYWYETQSEGIISSRLDWIAQYARGLAINFASLGSRWIMYNQLTFDCPVEGVKRLGPAGRLHIRPDGISYANTPFTPRMTGEFHLPRIDEKMFRLIDPVWDHHLCISLGLSGGLDSRVLLAYMLNSKNTRFSTHTFGHAADPDVVIPERISSNEGFPHVTYDAPLPDSSTIVTLLNDYVSQTNLVEPISTALRLRNYHGLDNSKFLLMDGAFGEVARRQYLNRLVMSGKGAITRKNVDVIFNGLKAHRADIFNEDVKKEMLSGARNEISHMFETMPDINTIGMDNYLDLWTVRTRLPNYTSDEQARLDTTIVNYMPFAQPCYIDEIFTMPVSLRRNGVLFRDTIRRLHAPLVHYPLAKNDTLTPFMLSTYTSRLWALAKNKLGLQYRDETTHVFLQSIKDFVMDLLSSQETKEYAPYDYSRIESIVNAYYRGNRGAANEVNWWLSFELWRRNIEIRQ